MVHPVPGAVLYLTLGRCRGHYDLLRGDRLGERRV